MNTKIELKRMIGQYEIRIEDNASTLVATKGTLCAVRLPIRNADVKAAMQEMQALLRF